MRVVATLLVAADVGVSAAFASGQPQPALADAIQAMHARNGSVYLADHDRRAVIVAASNEAQWKGYIAASVYAARGNPLHSVELVRPQPLGNVTMRFPAVNCACSRPGMNRLGKLKPASRQQVVHAIETAAKDDGARIDRIELLHPLAYAPVVTVTAHDPKEFLRLGKAPSLVAGLMGHIEGAYIIVRSRDGHVVANGGYTGRSYTVFGEVGWAIPV